MHMIAAIMKDITERRAREIIHKSCGERENLPCFLIGEMWPHEVCRLLDAGPDLSGCEGYTELVHVLKPLDLTTRVNVYFLERPGEVGVCVLDFRSRKLLGRVEIDRVLALWSHVSWCKSR